MAQLIARVETKAEADAVVASTFVEVELLARLRWPSLPADLDRLAPIDRGMLMLALQEGSDEEYPTELLESLRTAQDCVHYATVKRGRR